MHMHPYIPAARTLQPTLLDLETIREHLARADRTAVVLVERAASTSVWSDRGPRVLVGCEVVARVAWGVPFAGAFGSAKVELETRVDAAGDAGRAALLRGGEGGLGEKREEKEDGRGGGSVHFVCDGGYAIFRYYLFCLTYTMGEKEEGGTRDMVNYVCAEWECKGKQRPKSFFVSGDNIFERSLMNTPSLFESQTSLYRQTKGRLQL
jgi:hypothetical protein